MRTLYLIGIAGAVMARASLAEEPGPTPEGSPTPASALASVQKKEPTSSSVFADPSSQLSNIGGEDPVLTEQQVSAVRITEQWKQNNRQAMMPTPRSDGAIQFRYGDSLPVIVCTTLQVTDIELQPGEMVMVGEHDIHIGDPKRWSVETSVSGEGENQVQHLFVEPIDTGLSTTLDVTTNRRTYHIALISAKTAFMHHVAFVYRDAPPVTTAPAPAQKPAATPAVKVAYE